MSTLGLNEFYDDKKFHCEVTIDAVAAVPLCAPETIISTRVLAIIDIGLFENDDNDSADFQILIILPKHADDFFKTNLAWTTVF